MEKKYEDKIKLFTSLIGSLSVLGAGTADAQTIVTRDIDPDGVASIGSNYDLDIDNNGSVDFSIRLGTYTYNGQTTTHAYFRGNGYIGDNPPTVGSSNAHTFVNGSGSDWYVAKLNVGDTTSFTTEYNNNPYTRLFQIKNGNLESDYQFPGGTTDAYVGVQFTIGAEVHFGWVKLDIAGDYSTVTIKEVAFENSPGALMKAGANVSANKASGLAASDIAENQNGSDIQVSFTKASDESNISGYRIYVVKAANAANVKLSNLQTVAPANFTFVPKTGSDITTILSAVATDLDGDLITTNDYMVYVMSVGNNTTGDAITDGVPVSIVSGTTESSMLVGNMYMQENVLFFDNLTAEAQLSVVNMTGIEVYTGSVKAGSSQLDLGSLPNSVYSLTLSNNDIKVVKKITVIQK
jgi:translation initiation factor 6 (eIF-6)